MTAEEKMGYMLLSHNFNISSNILPELDRNEFNQVFAEGLKEQKNIHCQQLSHPHWMVKIAFPLDEISPVQVGELCINALVEKRKEQISTHASLPQTLFLAGKKTTPPLNDNPEGLQTGQWGVDVVETVSAKDFLAQIDWQQVVTTKNEKDVFKIERL